MTKIMPFSTVFSIKFSFFLLFLAAIFLFSGCGGSSTKIEPGSNTDEDSTDADFGTDEEENKSDYDTEIFDEDDDIKPFIDPCLEEPCKDVENSTGKCIAKGKTGDYICVCNENHVWFPNKRTCEPLNSFKGLSCTGQTKCYDNEKEIPCPKAGEPFFGQDANYAEKRLCLPQNFTIKNHEFGNTVIDNNSGLEWIQEVFSRQDGVYNTTWGEYSDWRMANFQDYNSIIDSVTFSPAINEAYFPGTPSDFFYTDMYLYDGPLITNKVKRYIPEQYWFVKGINFKTALTESNTYSVTQSHKKEYFRYVRDLPEKQESSIITLSKIDTLLPQKLLMKSSEKETNWENALKYCEDLTYAGISNWRLPNRNEAYFIFNQYKSSPCWSSTSYTGDPTQAIVYTSVYNSSSNISSDFVMTINKTEKAIVTCVASDPCPEGEIWNGEKCVSYE